MMAGEPARRPSRLQVAVTGAGGKTGRALLAAITAANHAVRALVRDPSRLDGLRASAVEPVLGDMTDVRSLVELVAGCEAVYHVPPNMSSLELQMAEALIDACGRTGVRRFVYHSVLHPQCETMPHHWSKLLVEERLLRSGLDPVFLQPAPYMQNLHPYLAAARAGEPMPFPYGPHVVLSMVDLRDVAEAATTVLTGDEHVGGSYQLCSADRLTQQEVWDRACQTLGLTAPFESISSAQWRETAGSRFPAPTAVWLASMFDHYEHHGLVGSSLPLERLLGRSPTSFDDHLVFVERSIDAGPTA